MYIYIYIYIYIYTTYIYIYIYIYIYPRYKTNLSTMIYSGGRKGFPIWFASANFLENSHKEYHKKNAFILF